MWGDVRVLEMDNDYSCTAASMYLMLLTFMDVLIMCTENLEVNWGLNPVP